MSERIFDTHVHWRDPRKNPYELLSDSADEDGERTGSEAQTYLPEDYFADMAGFDLAGFVHVEAEWLKSESVNETRWLEGLADGDRLRGLPLAIVGFCDLSKLDADAVLADHASHPRVRGIRHILNYLPGELALCWADRDYVDDPLWRSNFARLAQYGLDFDLMCFGHQLPAIAELAEQNPEVRIHLEHAALPHDHSDSGHQLWQDGMRALAGLPNTDVKISGLGNTVPDWTIEKIRPYVLDTIDIFSPARVSFASNSPTDKQFSTVAQIWEAFFEITREFPSLEREQMYCSNAIQSYRVIDQSIEGSRQT